MSSTNSGGNTNNINRNNGNSRNRRNNIDNINMNNNNGAANRNNAPNQNVIANQGGASIIRNDNMEERRDQVHLLCILSILYCFILFFYFYGC